MKDQDIPLREETASTSETELQLSPGTPSPFGATHQENGVNFAIAIKNAYKVFIVFFNEADPKHPIQEIELDPKYNKTGDVWHIHVQGLPPFALYGYRIFSSSTQQDSHLILDPYSKAVSTTTEWGNSSGRSYHPLGKVIPPSHFDWQGDKSPNIAMADLIIYEMHVRGLTRDPSSFVSHPGTFLGVIEKIPHLKNLGINALEIMPIHEFNECEATQLDPNNQFRLYNYFGYSTVNFFSPMNRYTTQSHGDSPLNEFKTMVRACHKNGIEVFLDVVYNHTSEGNREGPTHSFRSLNPEGYYIIDPHGNYLNFSGCGNTFNSNHPWSIELILTSLRYWVTEMHVDGFRFDLASIMTRGENGELLSYAPLIEAISKDPVLSQTKLIAEAWDAAGLYQVGGFYPGTRWAEWNGRYRDVVRRFMKGFSQQKTAFATAICGSEDLYGWGGRTPTCSINFVTAHDGFTLADLVSYNEKHNEDNGENNRDGCNSNESWNCGAEGMTSNSKITSLRERQMRNFHRALMISQGIPMILMGDEYAHTRNGNNNPWCQDNSLNWFLWNKLQMQPGFYRFFQLLIHFRKEHPILSRDRFLTNKDITWHGLTPLHPDWGNDDSFVAFTLNLDEKPSLYIAFNAAHVPQTVTIPPLIEGYHWVWVANTANPSPDDFFDEGERDPVGLESYRMLSNSALIFKASPV